MSAIKPKTIRRMLIYSCITALFSVQLLGIVSRGVGAYSSKASASPQRAGAPEHLGATTASKEQSKTQPEAGSGNLWNDARFIQPGKLYTGALKRSVGGWDYDLYSFKADAGQAVEVSFATHPGIRIGKRDTKIEILDMYGAAIDSSRAKAKGGAPSEGEVRVAMLPASEVYYVRVSSRPLADGASHRLNYHLAIETTSQPSYKVSPLVTSGWGSQVSAADLSLEEQMASVKQGMEVDGPTDETMEQYEALLEQMNDQTASQSASSGGGIRAMATSPCIAGALTNTDSTYNRTNTLASCPTLSGTGTNVFYDTYEFTVSGCASTNVTVSLCGTNPCAGTGTLADSYVAVYRAPGGTSGAFNPANPCTNVIAVNDDSCGSRSQVTASGVGPGNFVVVVTSFANNQQGTYNLFVDAPGGGCTLTQVVPCAPPPTPTITANPSPVAAGSAGNTATGPAGASSYTWTISNGSITSATSAQAITYTAGAAGSVVLGLTVTNDTGCSATNTLQVPVITQAGGAVCISGALTGTDPTYQRINASGFNVPPGNCTLSGVATNVRYDAYEFHIADCATFPTSVTATLCGPSGCGPVTAAGRLTDSYITIYRQGGATGPGGAPGPFNPSSPCSNAVAVNDDLGAAGCSFNGSLSGVTTSLGSGNFVVVVTSFGNGQSGTYNLRVNVPGATCSVGACPTITATVSGGGTICAGDSSSVTVSMTGGTPPYTVTLSNGGGVQTGNGPSFNFTVTPSATTTYSVSSATDSASCSASGVGSATVTVNQPPTTASAGADQSVCSATATLTGNMPAIGTGTWTLVSGAGTITSPGSPTTGVTGLGFGPNVFRWTITNGSCAASTDDVTITRDKPPTTADAGPDQTVCSATATLAGNTPAIGTGTWTLVSGAGTITSPNSATSGVTGLAVGANVFRWTITNGTCAASTDDVVITRDEAPTTANAGPDQNVCSSTTTLAANAPSVGTGTWTLVSGAGTITSPGSPTTGVTGLGFGPNVFRWTITNGTCPASTDDVTVSRSAPNAVCKNITVFLNSSGQASITAADVDGGSTSVCGIGSRSVSPNSFTCANVGPNTVTLTVTDVNGNSSQCTSTVTVVDNTPPSITCPANITAVAGAGVCSAVVTYTVGAGDNCGAVTVVSNPPSGSAFPVGTTPVVATATDASGNTATCSFNVTVTNPNPVATITGPPSGSIFAVNMPVSFTGTFTDAGGGTHAAQWTFTSINPTVNQPGVVNESTGAVSLSYSFASAGVYFVKLTVTDSCGGSGVATTVDGLDAMVVIYDSESFVTGGGWINSPAGAYVANAALVGKANFGFNSKYHNGSSIPTGQTEFQFKAGNFNFHSTDYEWLVVTGAKAQYKGSGTVNGSGSYGFIVTVIDGDVTGGGGADKFRIKIWNKNNGNAVVYDSQPGDPDAADPSTSLGGGSIVIH
ncbi:MAG: HYR domain-containing protein [Blastocatellia bacterium]